MVSKRMVKKQQMRWGERRVHLLLQVRTQVLNGASGSGLLAGILTWMTEPNLCCWMKQPNPWFGMVSCFSRSWVMHDLLIGLYMNRVEFGSAA